MLSWIERERIAMDRQQQVRQEAERARLLRTATAAAGQHIGLRARLALLNAALAGPEALCADFPPHGEPCRTCSM